MFVFNLGEFITVVEGRKEIRYVMGLINNVVLDVSHLFLVLLSLSMRIDLVKDPDRIGFFSVR